MAAGASITMAVEEQEFPMDEAMAVEWVAAMVVGSVVEEWAVGSVVEE